MIPMINFNHLDQALALSDFDSFAARQRMSPVPRGWKRRNSRPRQAAVMMLVYPDLDNRLHLVLTLRRADLRGHSGQVSFPGGQRDPQDDSIVTTAIRETCEEIGVCRDRIRILGSLPRFYIPTSHYDVYPTVARCDASPQFQANPEEVETIFSLSLEDLLQTKFKCEETWRITGRDVRVPYYAVQGHKVWGATATMLSELEERLRRVLPEDVLLELR